jgi:hypothetical protein
MVTSIWQMYLRLHFYSISMVAPTPSLRLMILSAIVANNIEGNCCQQLSAIINTNDPLEDLWLHINTCKKYADITGEAIMDSTIIRLTLEVFKVFDKTGVTRPVCTMTMRALHGGVKRLQLTSH